MTAISAIGRPQALRKPVQILIADESPMHCQLLEDALSRSRLQLKVIASATSQAAILSSMNSHLPDIALISESLEDGPLTGFRVLNKLREGFPRTRVVMLLKSVSQDFIVDAFRAGAKGVFCRAESVKRLGKCITAVHQGQVWANSSQLQCLLDAFVNASPLRVSNAQGQPVLTKREDDVVRLVVEGFTNREVAQKLGLTEHTVSNYLFRIYEKLGVSSRVELVLYSLNRTRA